jgi:hypothetical protein
MYPKIFFSSSPRVEESLLAWKAFFDSNNLSYSTDKFPSLFPDQRKKIPIIFGSWKDRKSVRHHRIKNKIVSSFDHFIVVETSLLGRQAITESFNENWFRIGVNGFLRSTGDFNWYPGIEESDSRWKLISKERSIEMFPWCTDSVQYILVCLQLPGDASLQGADISEWMLRICLRIRKFTDFPIVIRTPQLKRSFSSSCMNAVKELKNVTFEQGRRDNLFSSIDQALFVCTFSSGIGIDAILRGKPVYAESPASFVYELSTPLENAVNENFDFLDRQPLLNKLSYAQWSLDEIRDGLPWKHLVLDNTKFSYPIGIS